ncbi:MAG: hypothetical protein AB7C91_13650 [Sphaerochaeta sp.]|uniref:hypothetical protein n=1 Tax=Sphaerochaeta sp. TaxID=1972642 RepID=UPI003D0F9209
MLRINNDKAARIAQERIRVWRESAFSENDIRIQNALADGNEDARLQAVMYREYLRDLPQACIGKDLDGLKAVMDGVMSFQEYLLMGGSGE